MPNNGQPDWELVANLGDENPVDHGGAFVFIDKTGTYPPEVEILESPPEESASWDDETGEYSDSARWTVYRFIIEPCTYIDGVLSDNQYHPEYPAWFARRFDPERPQDGDTFKELADYLGATVEELAARFTSDDVRERAQAWIDAGNHWGMNNLDDYPIVLSRQEVQKHYNAPKYNAIK